MFAPAITSRRIVVPLSAIHFATTPEPCSSTQERVGVGLFYRLRGCNRCVINCTHLNDSLSFFFALRIAQVAHIYCHRCSCNSLKLVIYNPRKMNSRSTRSNAKHRSISQSDRLERLMPRTQIKSQLVPFCASFLAGRLMNVLSNLPPALGANLF